MPYGNRYLLRAPWLNAINEERWGHKKYGKVMLVNGGGDLLVCICSGGVGGWNWGLEQGFGLELPCTEELNNLKSSI